MILYNNSLNAHEHFNIRTTYKSSTEIYFIKPMDMIGGVIAQAGHAMQLNAKVQLRIRIIIYCFHSLLLNYK